MAILNGDTTTARRLLASGGMLSILLSGTLSPATWAQGSTKIAVASPGAKQESNQDTFKGQGSGQLTAMASSGKELGQCPLKHTSVTANVSGYVSRVTVKQTFHNPYKEKIEAVYTFPLSDTGAVDDMVMKVGQRTIHGTIKKKEEAKQIYEAAKARGNVASLLDQERPNIFTQSVANIEPGKEVEITIQYIDLLPYEDGKYTFAFPTVVGPRFNPGPAIGKQGTGWSHDTTEVPDASRITPPVTPEGTRAGHDISISVNINGGVPISNIKSALHEVSVSNQSDQNATVTLVDKNTIPNKDFVLKWDVAGEDIKSGYLTYKKSKTDKAGYFTMMLVPPKRVTPETVAPKEMIFLIDCSGSQSGKPLEKAKETLTYIVEHMNPNDSFQIISFNNRNTNLFERPRANSEQTRSEAKRFIEGLQANGGTWMGPAVEAVFNQPADKNRLRIVTFMTDGYVGNDMEILGLVKKHRGASRWFPFGTGNSVNRFLIDGIAREGGGESEFVLLNSEPGVVGKKFYDRISSPVLTDVKVSITGVDTKEVFPKDVSDVWAQKPLYIKGKYINGGKATATLSGMRAGQPYKQTINLVLPELNATNPGIASIWARAKVDRLMSEDWFGAQSGKPNKEIKDEIVATALEHHIMTQYTSFVAVEEQYVTKGGKPTLQVVPVEMPDGVSREGVFGKSMSSMPAAPIIASRAGGGGARFNFAPGKTAYYGAAGAGSHASADAAYLGGPGAGSVRGSLSQSSWGQARKLQLAPSQEAHAYKKSSNIAANSLAVDKEADDAKAKPEMKVEEFAPSAKLDPRLVGIQEALKKNNGHITGLTIKDGKVFVKVTVSSESKAILALLKKAGLENVSSFNAQGTKFTVTGMIAVDKLSGLTRLSEVIFITPMH
ncbi:VWA domain-containing protein [Candidatus Obscuribacterales bacterium]|nr:VWA domain-containing protein [Candidatus Obscuribacterales bacterium]